MNKVSVVIGIIFNSKQDVLIAQRQSHQEKDGLWEFPGGKIEPGETSFVALQRELKEEIDIRVIRASLWAQTEHDYLLKTIFLDVWIVTEFSGSPTGAEGQSIEWRAINDLSQRSFLAGNLLIIDRLAKEFFRK